MFLLKTLLLIPHNMQTWDGRNPSKKFLSFLYHWKVMLLASVKNEAWNMQRKWQYIGSKMATKAAQLPVLDLNSNYWWLQYSVFSETGGIFSLLHTLTTKIVAFQILHFQKLILHTCLGNKVSLSVYYAISFPF